MEKKLTLEQICNYLPYGLGILTPTPKITKVIGAYEENEITYLGFKNPFNNDNIIWFNSKDCTAILRKCDLTKPIMVNGKEEVPLIELAKMAYPEYEWFINNDECKAISDGIVCPREHFFIYEDYSFKYCYVETRGHYHTVPNQLALFEYIYSRIFDLKGLIEKGLALDADTLGTNLYNN